MKLKLMKKKYWIHNNDGSWVEYKGDPRYLRWEKGEIYWKLHVDAKPPIWVKGLDGFWIQIKRE